MQAVYLRRTRLTGSATREREHAASQREWGADADAQRFGKPERGWRLRLYTIIFEADTRAGKLFDLVLLASILASVAVVLLDSVDSISRERAALFDALEWMFTMLFTIEYLARLSCVRRPLRYARSFFGVVDLLAVLPTYLSLLVPGAEHVRQVEREPVHGLLEYAGERVAQFGENFHPRSPRDLSLRCDG